MIAGLGNPGNEYALTRHNAGLDFVNFQFLEYSLVPKKENSIHGSYAIKEFDDFKLIFLKPSTFMNESGKCISKAKKFFDLQTSQILIVHDELDLPNGYIKLKKAGGHGGHNGLRNIIDQMQGDNNFKRLRLGIGHPGKGKDVTTYVLKKASKKDRSQLEKTFDNCNSIGELIMTEGWEKTTMHFHTGKGASIES